MAIQIVMDFTGDSRHYFDCNDTDELAKAEQRFNKLTGVGFMAAVRTSTGEARKISAFDPSAAETLFLPRLIGG
jgi:hypothetical protein